MPLNQLLGILSVTTSIAKEAASLLDAVSQEPREPTQEEVDAIMNRAVASNQALKDELKRVRGNA